MADRLSILASGSSGNSALLHAEGRAWLIDFGLNARLLSARLAKAGSSWKSISGVLLTHTHSDHWQQSVLGVLVENRIPLYCHADHHRPLRKQGNQFEKLLDAGLVHELRPGATLALPGVDVRTAAIPHDSPPTLAFRFDGPPDLFGERWSVGFASDLGSVTGSLIELFSGVGTLALEFNHDVDLQRTSRRPKYLIDRVLGPYGHLSNDQAEEGVRTIVRRSGRPLRHLIQLHLSRECNRVKLAADAGRRSLSAMDGDPELTTVNQGGPVRFIDLDAARSATSGSVPGAAGTGGSSDIA